MFLLKYNSNLSPLSAGTRSRRAPQVSAQLHRSTCGERRGACTGAGRLHVQEGGGPTQTSQARLAQPQEGRQIDNVPCLRTHGRSGGRKRQGSADDGSQPTKRPVRTQAAQHIGLDSGTKAHRGTSQPNLVTLVLFSCGWLVLFKGWGNPCTTEHTVEVHHCPLCGVHRL